MEIQIKIPFHVSGNKFVQYIYIQQKYMSFNFKSNGITIREPLNKSGRVAMRIKIVKCEARNAVNIGNIDKFRNDAVDDYKLMDASHDLFRGSLNPQKVLPV